MQMQFAFMRKCLRVRLIKAMLYLVELHTTAIGSSLELLHILRKRTCDSFKGFFVHFLWRKEKNGNWVQSAKVKRWSDMKGFSRSLTSLRWVVKRNEVFVERLENADKLANESSKGSALKQEKTQSIIAIKQLITDRSDWFIGY